MLRMLNTHIEEAS